MVEGAVNKELRCGLNNAMIFTKCFWDLRKNNSFSCECVKEALEKSVLMLQVEKKFTCLEKKGGTFQTQEISCSEM